MRVRTILTYIFIGVIMVGGCATQPRSDVKRLNEKAVAEQELIADQARIHFDQGEYAQCIDLIKPLCEERSTSQPLYLCELGTAYLACDNKTEAKECFFEAYTSLESFLDVSSEKKAVSLWGSEAEKVYKGEPYEQASLSLLMGLLLLEEGDVDNALSCFKNGQFADSDVENEKYQSDYGLLQMLEAKCYQLRQEENEYQQFSKKALDSFVKTHPYAIWKRSQIEMQTELDPNDMDTLAARLKEVEESLLRNYESYNSPWFGQYNTFLMLWIGRSPELRRSGEYGENRVIVKNSDASSELHFEILIDNTEWYDVINGYGNISFQATTRGGREMDNVLASQAVFKRTSYEVRDTFFDAAGDTSDPYAALAMYGIGMIAHGVGAATNVKADIRCWKTLPDQIAVVPLQLEPGTHLVRIDCYTNHFELSRSITKEINVQNKPFQLYTIIKPYVTTTEAEMTQDEMQVDQKRQG